ncbi:hypothetical protein [Tateyamaria sp. syn59]|uniref:hypothetical protein n=1 Tax=Tateyamaria sp. syn59 TaxID=2576942 RepID=UPI0011BF9F15|nr:hypothetical protein [Tateyamaria sp. syn59]
MTRSQAATNPNTAKYYSLIEGPSLKPIDTIYAEDLDAYYEAESRGDIYLGPYIADDVDPTELALRDWIPNADTTLVTDRFVAAMRLYPMRQPDFVKVRVIRNGQDVAPAMPGGTRAFYAARFPKLDAIDDEKTPMHLWPRFKKFKLMDYVITRPMPDDVHIGIDERKPRVVLCTEEFKSWAERDSLNVDFTPVPCVI